MVYKIKNITKDTRKFRIKHTAEGFLIRPGEELEIHYPPIREYPDIFKVTDLSKIQEKEILEDNSKKKRIKEGENK